ncbi:MAG: type II toxin-antitoxin system death-on-curing family toxin [Bacteroidaceae bacterium]|nr:type II toxin-antitoxin system death-on-curing family toxin [Bacteroidaceae bacterium]
MVIYIPKDLAIEIHRNTIEYSGGGDYNIINIGFLDSVLEHIQNDDYYPTFGEKLTHLVWSINRNHSFSDGNKRLSITLGAQFLLLNGYMFCVRRFLEDMENISYHLAAGRIEKELLSKLIQSFLDGEDDFNEALKLEYLLASADGTIGFDE